MYAEMSRKEGKQNERNKDKAESSSHKTRHLQGKILNLTLKSYAQLRGIFHFVYDYIAVLNIS